MNSPVAQLISREIQERGVIPFARFMELALYALEVGYYETSGRVGKAGDFYTSVSVGPLFGALIARKCAEWLPSGGSMVEAGANNGQLAFDILSALRANDVQYIIVEPSARQQQTQKEKLRDFASRLRWVSSLCELDEVEGVIISNELLDAMPVHVWRWQAANRTWVEMGVMEQAQEFRWAPIAEKPREQLPWITLPSELLDQLPDGFTTEEHAAANGWWKSAATKLKRGYLMGFDYGLEAEEFLAPERAQGTVRAYSQHRVSPHVLANPGEQDITAHVNFTAIRRAGEDAGLKTFFDGTQTQFLHSIAAEWIRETEAGGLSEKWDQKMVRQFQTLTHPEHLGRSFRVLVQQS